MNEREGNIELFLNEFHRNTYESHTDCLLTRARRHGGTPIGFVEMSPLDQLYGAGTEPRQRSSHG